SLRSHWVPYEIGRAIALAKPLIAYVTNVALEPELPHYIRDLRFATTIVQVEDFFREGIPAGPTTRRVIGQRRYLTPERTAREVLDRIFRTKYFAEQDTMFENHFKERWVCA